MVWIPSIGPIPGDFFSPANIAGANPEVVYVGPMPQSPSAYYRLAELFPAPRRGREAFVYILLHCDGSAVYVGKARNPGNRFDKHRRREWWEEVYHLILLRVTGDDQTGADRLALHVESYCIRKSDPTYNIAGAKRRPGIPRGVFS